MTELEALRVYCDYHSLGYVFKTDSEAELYFELVRRSMGFQFYRASIAKLELKEAIKAEILKPYYWLVMKIRRLEN